MSRPLSSKSDIYNTVKLLCCIYETHKSIPIELVDSTINLIGKAPPFAVKLFYDTMFKKCKPAMLEYFSGDRYNVQKIQYDIVQDNFTPRKVETPIKELLKLRDSI